MSETKQHTIDEITAGLQRLINSHFNMKPSAVTRVPAQRDDDDLMLSDAIDELAALRAWRAQAEPLLAVLTDDHRDEDGDCIYCWQPRRDAHADDCPVTQARALLASEEEGK